VAARLATDEQVECPPAADPPGRGEPAHDLGDVRGRQWLPRPEGSEVAGWDRTCRHRTTVT
jgi:hypothetical protein